MSPRVVEKDTGEVDLMSRADAEAYFADQADLLRQWRGTPRPFACSGSSAAGAADISLPQVGLQNPIGPPAGFYWDVRRITVTGPDPTSAVAGRCYFYVSPVPVGDNSQGLAFIDWAPSLPLPSYFARQIIVPGGPPVWFRIVRPPASTR